MGSHIYFLDHFRNEKIMRLSLVRMFNYFGPRGVNTERYRKFTAKQRRYEWFGKFAFTGACGYFIYAMLSMRQQYHKWAEMTLNAPEPTNIDPLTVYLPQSRGPIQEQEKMVMWNKYG